MSAVTALTALIEAWDAVERAGKTIRDGAAYGFCMDAEEALRKALLAAAAAERPVQ